MVPKSGADPSALLVHNFPPGTGFAWEFIGELMSAAAHAFHRSGLRVFTSYPLRDQLPTGRMDWEAGAVSLDPSSSSWRSQWQLFRFLWRNRVKVVYLADQPLLRIAYAFWRLAGVRRVVVHDHTSGTRPRPGPTRRLLKRAAWRVPGLGADLVIGVSEFVVERLRVVGCVPESRLALVRNGVRIPEVTSLHRQSSPAATRAVAIARATPVKGIDVLLRAWRQVLDRWPKAQTPPLLQYAGDGPMLERLRALVVELALQDHVELLGYRDDIDRLLREADICVVPSVWAEAFCLVVAESMSWGVPVVATDTGAIPEVLGNSGAGILVPPGDSRRLADALLALLLMPADERNDMGRKARGRAVTELSIERTMSVLDTLLTGVVTQLSSARPVTHP